VIRALLLAALLAGCGGGDGGEIEPRDRRAAEAVADRPSR
jgi:hypothetical protein